MKRKTSSIPTRIWTFGCLPPSEGADKVRDQLKAAHEYYNVLVGVELDGRAKYREARRSFAPKIALLEEKEAKLTAEVDNVEAAIKECRRKAAAAKVGHKIRLNPKDLQERAKTFKVERRTIREQLRAERLKIKESPKFLAIVEALNVEKANLIKGPTGLRKASGLYWGNYLLTEKAWEAAKSGPNDPRPKYGSGIEGRVGVQIQPGVRLTTANLLSGANHTILRLEPTDGATQVFKPGQWDTRSGRRAAKAVVCLRVGSDEKGKPVWAKFPVIFHRELPEGEIKWAWVNVYKVGTRFKYELQLAVESQSFSSVPTGKGVVAVSIGYSSNGDGSLILGEAVDDQGRTFTCTLSKDVVDNMTYPEVLQHFADDHFNVARNVLARELKAGAKVPEWIREETQTISHWHSASKLARIAGKWTSEAFPDRDVLESLWQDWKAGCLVEGLDLFVSLPENPTQEDYAKSETEIRTWLAARGFTRSQTLCLYLEWWRRKNRHLYQWACDQRHKSRGHRDEIFKIFAAMLSRTYETVLLRDIDWSVIARRAAPEADRETPQGVRSNRQVAAPGNLESFIVSAAGKPRVKFLTYVVDGETAIDINATPSTDGQTIARALLDLYYTEGAVAAE